jgi:hypothetical protein
MTTFTQAQATKVLESMGFRVRSNAEFKAVIRTFQAGYNAGPWLTIDGICGPATSAALAQGRASAHFKWAEFKCTCGGRYSDCRRIRVSRDLLASLEKYRTRVGRSVTVVSGYRCPGRNAEVGGASDSQHLYGFACDVKDRLSREAVKDLHALAGIGRDRVTGQVEHLDRRDKSGHNNGGTLDVPMEWTYN